MPNGTTLPGRVLCSPHLSGYGSAWAGALAARVLRPPLRALRCAALTASPSEARTLSRLLERSAEVLPHCVTGEFFEAERRESEHPSVLADGAGAAGVDLVSRLSVLLNSRGSRVRISWLGALDGRSAARISAAIIEPLAPADDAMRARALAGATAFVYVSSLDAVPLAVSQAMAAAVPCLVSDTSSHRELVRHGETGYIGSRAADSLEKLIFLLRTRAAGERLGAAARAEAERWFTLRHFERAVLRAYGFHVH